MPSRELCVLTKGVVVKRKSNCWLAVVLLAVGVAEICPGYELRRTLPDFGEAVLTTDEPGAWRFELSDSVARAGVCALKIVMDAPEEAVPPMFRIRFERPGAGADHLWSPYDDRYQLLPKSWIDDEKYTSQLAFRAPLLAAFGDGGTNVLSLSCSETFRKVSLGISLGESDCNLRCFAKFFAEPEAPLRRYETTLRIDARKLFWADAVREAADWLTSVNGFRPCPVPPAAYDPLYSTWYAFWQDVRADVLEREMPRAHALGMRTAILDDGWQKQKSTTFYSATGDWLPVASRFPDMKRHVDAVHAAGMRYMLWFSVPYVGEESKAWERFQGKFLRVDGKTSPGRVGILDPRFPEVRTHLVEMFARAVKDWGFDGLKLDFIDQFRIQGVDPAIAENYAGRNYKSVPQATDVLMRAIVARLTELNPEVLLEFRQHYMGPAIRQYGNMIRALDCPGDSDKIRKLIADLRLTSGTTAVHSDMLVWNRDETPERAARPILNSLFSVIQYSMVLDGLPEAHREVIRNWLAFSQKHRDTLLKSSFRPYHPELLYPRLEAESAAERIVALYSMPSPVEFDGKALLVVNATEEGSIPMRLRRRAEVRTFNVFGRPVESREIAEGVAFVAVPRSGFAEIR